MLLMDLFFGRIVKDLCHKELLPLKFIFFVKTSTLYVLYPYLTIHMRELGINVEETAIMSAITPFVAIIMPPLAGLVADRIGNFKLLMAILSVIGGLAALLLLLVPVGRATVKYPDRVILDLTCGGNDGGLIYSLSNQQFCINEVNETLSMRLESCGYSCYFDANDNVTEKTITTSTQYSIQVLNQSSNQHFSYGYTVPHYALPKEISKDDIKNFREMKNNEYFDISIRQLSNNYFFFPVNPLKYSCNEHFSGSESQQNGSQITHCYFDTSKMFASNFSNNVKHEYQSNVSPILWSAEDKSEGWVRYLVNTIKWDSEFKSAQCSDSDDNLKVDVRVPLINKEMTSSVVYETLELTNCTKKCLLSTPRSQICTNKEHVVEYNTQLTFWLYLSIRVFLGIIGGTAFAMFEGAVIAILREQKADYGMQRIYGSIGGMISSPLSGLMIDYASQGRDYTDFRPAFYLYAALKIISGALIMMINLEFKAPAHNVVSHVLTVLKDIEIVALLLTCFILGTAWGYLESFLFWFLQDLGGSRSLMGITVTVGGIAGLPLLVLSGPIINKLGHANVIFIGFIFYCIRLVGYSIIYNPWHALIFEALESITSSLSFTAAVTYAAKLSTTSIDSSIQGLLGGLYYGVGKGFGSLIGGYLMKAYGTRPTYRMYAGMTLVTGIMYFIFNMTYLRKRRKRQALAAEKREPTNITDAENGKVIDSDETDMKKAKEIEAYTLKDTEKPKQVTNESNNLEKTNNDRNLEKDVTTSENAKKEQENKTENSSKVTELNGISNPALDIDESSTDESSQVVQNDRL